MNTQGKEVEFYCSVQSTTRMCSYLRQATARCLETVSSILSAFCDKTCLQETKGTGYSIAT